MNIIKDYIYPNNYSRPQTEMKELKAIVMHWTANPRVSAKANKNYFENLPQINRVNISNNRPEVWGSAHYIIGLEGEIIKCMNENEVAYHCGTSKKDPKSGRYYTDYARAKFGDRYTDINGLTPNYCTIGIELCPIDKQGNFNNATIEAAVELCADICKRYGLTEDDITTHNEIVGWKDCPRLWTNKPEYFIYFKALVNGYIHRGNE